MLWSPPAFFILLVCFVWLAMANACPGVGRAASKVVEDEGGVGETVRVGTRTYFLLTQYTTFLDGSQAQRTSNIRLAARAIDGYVAAPGEVVSFNRVVGPRSAASGYAISTVISGNRFVTGMGGGVCQVASNLYNAALRAGLPIVERHPHSLAVSYVEPGLDASVAYGGNDLRFANDTGGYLLLRAVVEDGRLTVKVLTTGQSSPQVRVRVTTLETIDPVIRYCHDARLPAGETLMIEQGRPGYQVLVTRIVYRPGGGFTEEVISRDTYRGQPRLIKVGTGVEPWQAANSKD